MILKFPPQVRDNAVALVLAHENEYPSRWAAIKHFSEKIGCSTQSLRMWIRDAGHDREPKTAVGEGASEEPLRAQVIEKPGQVGKQPFLERGCAHSWPFPARLKHERPAMQGAERALLVHLAGRVDAVDRPLALPADLAASGVAGIAGGADPHDFIARCLDRARERGPAHVHPSEQVGRGEAVGPGQQPEHPFQVGRGRRDHETIHETIMDRLYPEIRGYVPR